MKQLIAMTAIALAAMPHLVTLQSVTGRWRMIWDSAVRDDGRRVTQVVRRDTMELRIEARGDSFVAIWRRPNVPVPANGVGPGTGLTLHGRLTGDSLILTGVPAASSTRPGFTPLRSLTLRARYRGDALEGLVLAEGANGPLVPRRFEGTRWE